MIHKNTSYFLCEERKPMGNFGREHFSVIGRLIVTFEIYSIGDKFVKSVHIRFEL